MRHAWLAVVALVALAASSAHAGAILYTTAATVGRVDGFCLGDNGGISGSPVFERTLAGTDPNNLNPRRVVVVPFPTQNVLYVATHDFIQVFPIDTHGRLGTPANIPVLDPRDLTVFGNVLYATLHRGVLVGFRLNPNDGMPLEAYSTDTNPFFTCVDGGGGAYQDLAVATVDSAVGALVFVTGGGTTGRIDVYQLADDGRLINSGGTAPCTVEKTVSTTTTTTTTTTTSAGQTTSTTFPPMSQISQRRGLGRPKGFAIFNGILYVEEKDANRILAFTLQPTGFCEYSNKDLEPVGTMCSGPINPDKLSKGRWKQPPSSKTAQVSRYQQLALAPGPFPGQNGDTFTLIGSQFNEGRIDAYRVNLSDGMLRKQQEPTRRGQRDVRRSPVRMLVVTIGGNQMLYVAGGIKDRSFVFRLGSDGLPETEPFSSTDEDRNSFPNDVAVAMLSDACE